MKDNNLNNREASMQVVILNSQILEKYLRFFQLLLLNSLIIMIFSLILFSGNSVAKELKPLRIGCQPYGTLILVEGRGKLGLKLASLGVAPEWIEFKTGMEMMDGFKDGKLDFIVVGEAPPVFMQSAGIDLVYIGYEPPSPKSVAVVIAKNSTIATLADLKGKKIAFAKGTNVHFLFFKVLEKAGLTEKDVQIIYLPPIQGHKALASNTIDAWVIWDPFLAAAQQELGAKILIDGEGLVPGYQFYLARRDYAEQNSQVIEVIIEEIKQIEGGIKQNPSAVAKFLAPRIGLSTAALETALSRMNTGIQLMDTETMLVQQELANLFYQKGLIKKISLKDVLWKLP
jgi:sulfonate transport system substrate-binding protein